MISSEVQRTLVKSPPELWAELSDPAALARHLGELGEIRITRVDPEQAVEWEAGEVTGRVLIKPSGWGTKVTLTASGQIDGDESPAAADSSAKPEPAEAEPQTVIEPSLEPAAQAEPEPEPAAEAEPEVWHEPMKTKPQTAAGAWAEPMALEPETRSDASPEQTEAEPEPDTQDDDRLEPGDPKPRRRDFFSRLFRRRLRKEAVEPEASETIGDAEPQPDPPEVVTAWEQALNSSAALVAVESPAKPVQPPEERQAFEGWGGSEVPDTAAQGASGEPIETAAQPKEADDVTAERVTEVLTAVLDRLGAAHHRPFSRG
jgi:hypothetical protein